MTATLVFLAALMGGVIWWLVRPSISAQPWVATSTNDDLPDYDTLKLPAKAVALGTFLAVVTSVFGLFLSAYMMRMELPDWVPLTEPGLLWVNTICLVLASIAFQHSKNLGNAGEINKVHVPLLTGGGLTILFLAGQLWVWQQLNASGYYAVTNPANAFFYLLTGLHGLHLVGGLWVWGKAAFRLNDESNDGRLQLKLSVDLCTVYWHYLLLVWLVLFALLLAT
jgi:cytochrome c oxidase subunit 3